MRKHSVRKWIHAILDMLPLVVIPIFAIYSHRHTIDSYSVQVEETKVVDFNQQIDNVQYLNIVDDVSFTGNVVTALYPTVGLPSVVGHTYLFKCNFDNYSNSIINGVRVRYPWVSDTYNTSDIYIRGVAITNDNFCIQVMKSDDSVVSMESCDLSILQLFDLSQMFGVGNEPTTEQFNILFPEDYYDFTLSKKILLNTGNVITYNDTDIGSQFVYQLYNVTDKYFNFNKVGTFQDIYNWFDINLFGGTSPMSFFIVWNIILYEFIMDLIFLTYMLFMFIIDFAEHLIDCFFDKSYRGGR